MKKTSELKNITFSADEKLIQLARQKAIQQKRTLNQVFRDWLENYTNSKIQAVEYNDLMRQLSYVKVDKKFSREELNRRD